MLNSVTKVLMILPCLLALAGCGSEVKQIDLQGEDRKISDVIEEFNESRTKLKDASPSFVKGAAPSKDAFKSFASKSISPAGSPKIEGDSAKMTVTIHDEKTGKDVGQTEWTFKKEADGWKIATAPLP